MKHKKILFTRDIPFEFNQRLYHRFKAFFEVGPQKLFYNKDYYRDIASFCSDNSINLSISELLALNFFFISKNKNESGSEFLMSYLQEEKIDHGLVFLNSHVQRAKQIICALEAQAQHKTLDSLSPGVEASYHKLSDILNIYCAYDAQEFEALSKGRIHDFHSQHNTLLDIEETYMSHFLHYDQSLGDSALYKNTFKTEKFQLTMEPFLKENLAALMYNHQSETQAFKEHRKRMH